MLATLNLLENQLFQDLSTALWLFTALGSIINIPKSVTVPTQCLEFRDKYTNHDHHSITTENAFNSEGGNTTCCPLSILNQFKL